MAVPSAPKRTGRAAEWDARFRASDHSGPDPDPFLVSAQEALSLLTPRATVLDLACGAGRNAVWLSRQGFRVTAVDFSAEALAKTRLLAREHGVTLECRRMDLESPSVDLGAWHLICGFFFLHRPLFPLLRQALHPGGLLIYKTYTIDRLRSPGGPRNPRHQLEPNELLRLAEGLRVLRYEEGSGTAAIVAQRFGQ